MTPHRDQRPQQAWINPISGKSVRCWVLPRTGQGLRGWRIYPGEALVSARRAVYGVMVMSSGVDSMLPLSVCSAMTSPHCPGGTAYSRSGTIEAVPIKTGTARLW